MSFAEKAKIVDRGSLCSALESTGSKLQYEPYLFSIACSQARLSISEKIWEIRQRVVSKKLKSLIDVPHVAHLIIQVLSHNMNHFYCP